MKLDYYAAGNFAIQYMRFIQYYQDSGIQKTTVPWTCVSGGGMQEMHTGKCQDKPLQCRRDLIIPGTSAQSCPPRNIISRQSRVCQPRCQVHILFAGTDGSFPRWTYWCVLFPLHDCHSNEDLTTTLNDSVLPGGLLRYRQGSLNLGGTITLGCIIEVSV